MTNVFPVRLGRRPRFAGTRLRMVNLKRMVDPIVYSLELKFLGTRARRARSEPLGGGSNHEPEPPRRGARVFRIQWEREEDEVESRPQPGAAPAQSLARGKHAFRWTW